MVHQWYVEEFIKPIFVPKFIEDTYACIEGRGVHKAVKKLRQYMFLQNKQSKNFYILKCDIKKFFHSIDKEILFNIISRYIKDRDFLDFTRKILYQNATKPIGIPIGNYTSQYFANIYLSKLDHYVKEQLKIKYYVRFMDDFILLFDSKGEAKKNLYMIKKFLANELKLELNSKTNYFKGYEGVNFCGFKIYFNKIKLRKQNKKRIYNRVNKWNKLYIEENLNFKKAICSLNSWKGHAGHVTNKALIKEVVNKCNWILN